MKTFGMSLSFLGALMIVFGVILWFVNKPDFSNMVTQREEQKRSAFGRSLDYDERQMWIKLMEDSKKSYQGCLFSAQAPVCQQLAPVSSYLNIGGLLLLVSGMGLFVIGAMTRPARA